MSDNETPTFATLQPVPLQNNSEDTMLNYSQMSTQLEPATSDESAITEAQINESPASSSLVKRKRGKARKYEIWQEFSSMAEYHGFWNEEQNNWRRRRSYDGRNEEVEIWVCQYGKSGNKGLLN